MSAINTDTIRSVLFGVATGDALGVPVEFSTRAQRHRDPVTDMTGYGTYNLPPGTWSDDSSLTFCLAESVAEGFDLKQTAGYFIKWARENFWVARGSVFDIGAATCKAINRLAQGVEPELAGGTTGDSNGNGSLMRIAPLLFILYNKPVHERYLVIKQVSSLTHAHILSVFACFYYLEYALLLYNGTDGMMAYNILQEKMPEYMQELGIDPQDVSAFDRLLKQKIYELSEDQIESTGYVLHTLEASLWSLLTTDTYKEAVLKAVNLGHDTDTTAAVTGGLAGLYYGFKNIPKDWISQLARVKDIEDLAGRIAQKLN